MINFNDLELNKDKYRLDYLSAKPFPFIVIKNFCDLAKISELYNQIPNLTNKVEIICLQKTNSKNQILVNLVHYF